MSVARRSNTSAWQLIQTKDLPPESFCKSVATKFQQHIWHAWNRSGFCVYHHIGGLKAPVARVVANRRSRETPTPQRRPGAESGAQNTKAADQR